MPVVTYVSFSFTGLGLAYAGSNREAVLSLLTPVLSDPKSTMEVVGLAGMACGMIAVGSCNADVTGAIVQTLMERSEADLKDTYARFLPLGLGLCHLGMCFTFSVFEMTAHFYADH